MPILPQSNGLLFLLGGASVVAYLAYEYKEKMQMTKKFNTAVNEIQSSDIETQTIGVESLVGYVSNNKALIKDLCDQHPDIFSYLPEMIFSDDEDAQFAVLEFLSIVSQEVQGLDAIRHSNIFSTLISVLSSPSLSFSPEILQLTLSSLKNCTNPPLHKTIFHPNTGQPVKVPIERVPLRSGNEEYEHEEEWFARELYQQHGLEPVINKLLSDENDIQALALEIIINYCKTLKNQDEIGELGGIGFMITIFTSSLSSPSLKSLSLSALRYCMQNCTCNVEQFRKAGGIKVIVTYFKNDAPTTLQGSEKQDDVFNALKILNITIDSSGIETIKTEHVIPQFVGYFMQESNADIKNTTVAFLKQLAHMDPKCRREISDAFKKENKMGNAGVPPKSR